MGSELLRQNQIFEKAFLMEFRRRRFRFSMNSDERNELVVGRTGYARALRFDRDDPQMVDQFNAAQGDDSIDAVLPLQCDGGLEGIVTFDQLAIQFLEAGLDGVFAKTGSQLLDDRSGGLTWK